MAVTNVELRAENTRFVGRAAKVGAGCLSSADVVGSGAAVAQRQQWASLSR
jgi:hypothetical protein